MLHKIGGVGLNSTFFRPEFLGLDVFGTQFVA
jgi:hypothetical protein